MSSASARTADTGLWGDPFLAYLGLRRPGLPGALLESARPHPSIGRYSLVVPRADRVIRWRRGQTGPGPLGELRDALGWKPSSGREETALPFTGGAVGFFSYEAKRLFEPRLPENVSDDLRLPDAYFLLVSEGLLFDHAQRRSWAFSAERSGCARLKRALARALKTKPSFSAPRAVSSGFRESLGREAFQEAVRRAKEHIRAGDIYQANLSRRMSFPLPGDPLAVYSRMRRINPSPFFGFLDGVDFQIACGSPERLVRLRDGALDTRPIAGTRKRTSDDRAVALELLLSEKERAEHVMLVDLERNDLGRVALPGSVAVDELMAIEDYSHVKHIVSNVRARLKPGLDGLDAISALFPGGTITGAPKFRCMQLIDELEPVVRGPYTGSLGYASFSGNMDFNIVIRSLVAADGAAHVQAGAGIVADSVPEKEYEETVHKAQAVLEAALGVPRAVALGRVSARRVSR